MSHASICVIILVFLVAISGCNGLGLDRDTATVTPAPVPTVTEHAPKEGHLYLENQRSDDYRAELSVFRDRVANLTVTYSNGSERTFPINYSGPLARVDVRNHTVPLPAFGRIRAAGGSDNISNIEPDGNPMWEDNIELPVRSTRLVALPEGDTELVIYIKITSANQDEIRGIYVLECSKTGKKPYIELESQSGTSWGGC